ncbi:MAG: efflux RND transporter periplasmic adaptor subunit [Planctomycetota bacterium]
MKKILFLLIAVAIVGGGYYAYDRIQSAKGDDASNSGSGLYTVRRGDLKISITENGTLMAKDSKKVNFEAEWEGKIVFLVEEGKEVKVGEVLCKMDMKSIQVALEQAELDIVQAEANLKSARTEVEIQVSENEGALEKAKIAVEKAEKELERYTFGDAPHERRKFLIAIKDAETNHKKAQKRLQDSERLMTEDYIKKTELENDKIEFERSEVQLEGAKNDLAMFEKYTFPMTTKDKKTTLKDGRRELSSVRKRNESKALQKSVRVTQNEKQLKRYNKRLDDRKEAIGKMVMTAPCPGILIYGDPRNRWMADRIKIGGEIWGGNTIFTIPDLRVMQVKLAIHEADINKIKIGQIATVTMDTYPGVVLKGTVTKIAAIANSSGQRSSGEVKKFDVLMTLEQEEGKTYKPGISAKAEIHIAARNDVLYVPLQSVFLEEGKHFCHVSKSGGSIEKRKIEVGQSNDTFMEIIEGVGEGDKVLMYNPDLGSASDAESDDSKKDDDDEGDKAGGGASGRGKPAAAPKN